MSNQNRKAFSLVEISLVILIIGILAAAATMSKDLITNSKIKKAIIDIESIKTAIKTFHGAYDDLPGDFNKAELYWGSDTADGNSNGIVEYTAESYYVFEHLKLAKVIGGDYSPDADNYAFKLNFADGYARFLNTESLSGFQDDNVNVLQIGATTTTDEPLFIPDQAKKIDGKFDDGAPNSGRVTYRITDNTTAANCTNDSDSYYVAYTLVACNLVFRTDL